MEGKGRTGGGKPDVDKVTLMGNWDSLLSCYPSKAIPEIWELDEGWTSPWKSFQPYWFCLQIPLLSPCSLFSSATGRGVQPVPKSCQGQGETGDRNHPRNPPKHHPNPTQTSPNSHPSPPKPQPSTTQFPGSGTVSQAHTQEEPNPGSSIPRSNTKSRQ